MKNVLLLLFLTFCFEITAQVTKTMPSGSGTEGDPYRIASLGNLSWLVQTSSAWNKYYKQTANIDATGTQYWDDANDDDGGDQDLYNDANDGTATGNDEGFYPIGTNSNTFTGTYDGNGYKIDNLYISRSSTSYCGFIGATGAATVKNLGLTDVNILGLNRNGGLIGATLGTTAISNCYTTGSVDGGDYIGGLIGNTSSGSSTINRCYSSATWEGNYGGGIVGYNIAASLTDCYATGSNTSGSSNSHGGVVGYNGSSQTITNCYSIATVSYGGNKGSLVGYNGGTISGSFWNTTIQATGVGGGTTTGATGKTTAEMKIQSTFTAASWDVDVWNMGDGINDGYPYLDWQNPSGTPLPVELVSFKANLIQNVVQLNWQTATEVNNYGFDIQRSVISNQPSAISGQLSEWETIGFVNGHGNSNSPKDYVFVDANVVENGKYFYRLKQIDTDGKYEYSKEIEIEISQPIEFALLQNYPNPFNPSTVISYQLSASSNVTLKIYDILGNEVATLIDNEWKEAGYYNYQLLINNYQLPSGVYYYQLVAGDFTSVKKLVVIK